MKNSIVVLIAIIICTPGNQLIAGTYAGGSGTPKDPYQIETAEQLNEIGLYEEDWDKHFQLINNIDIKHYDGQNGNPTFNIVGYWIDHFDPANRPFTGTFDGNGFLIHNLTCLSTDRNTVGLFGFIEDAKIKDLGMVDVLLDPHNPDATGGLVGRSKRGKISNCYATGSVSSDLVGGGLIGVNSEGTIHDCYSTAEVSGYYAGGLAGANGGTIYLCYSTGRVTKTDLVYDWGALVGWNIGLVTNCYWNLDTNSSNASEGDAGKTTYEMTLRQTYYGWGNNNTWTIDDGRDYPRLRWENKPGQPISNSDFWQGEGTAAEPYRIHTPQELNRIGLLPYEWSKHFRLMNDIDLSSFNSSQINILSGMNDTPFSGVFDGNSHSIANLKLNRAMAPCGLFASVSGNIKNLEMVDPNIVNQMRLTGAVAGQLLGGGIISNCSVKGGKISGSYYCAGGLVGWNMGSVIDCSVDQCHVSLTPLGLFAEGAGGLVGENYGIILNSHSSGKVDGLVHIGGVAGGNSGVIFGSSSKCKVNGSGAGGLVGWNYGNIVSSFCEGPVSGSFVGGLVGYNGSYKQGNINSCYSNSNVNGERHVGGLVGYNSNGTVRYSYSTGIVTGEAATLGGLIGFHDEGVVYSSFWDIETSGTTRSSRGIGLTTEQMQTSEVYIENGWDFTRESANGTSQTWQISQGQYPSLSHFVGYPEAYLKGAGTEQDPYLIHNAEELGAVNADYCAHYELRSDIDLSDITWSTAVIPVFLGTLNGADHEIRNLNIKDSSYCGLFGYTDHGTIKNVRIENYTLTGGPYSSCLGGLVGYNRGSSIRNYKTKGMTIANKNSDCVGGLAGRNYGQIIQCFSAGNVYGGSSSFHVGGLVGNTRGNVRECYSIATVTGGRWVGGLAGVATGAIVNCYAVSGVKYDKSRYKGGLIGSGSSAYIESSYFPGSAASHNGLGTPLSLDEMTRQESFLGWDFIGESANGAEEIWGIHNGLDYPRLWWEFENLMPQAHAGSDQTVYASFDGFTEVTLDGSASYDEDADELDYSWSWETEGQIYQVQDVNPVIQLPPGEFEITLIVSDGIVDSEPETVLIQVIAPVEASLFLVPQIINTNSKGKNILAILTLPEGIQIEDIDSDYGFVLYPPKAPSVLYRSINRKDSTRLFILFDREQVASALSEKKDQELTVVTKLNTGQYLYAADTVKIVEPQNNKTKHTRRIPRRNTSSPSVKRQTRPRRKPNVPIPR